MSKSKKVLIRNKEDYFKAKQRLAYLEGQDGVADEWLLLTEAISEFNLFYKIEPKYILYAGLELVEDEG